MKFITDDFLLDSEAAKKLYNDYAKDMPIFDYHCHLSPKEIYEDRPYETLTAAWLGENGAGDHYKWRQMRANGVAEEYITGNADPKEKFDRFVDTLSYAVGNPLYTWAHLELRSFFGIDDVLSAESADRIYREANEKLRTLTPRQMILRSNVRALCTTDDPTDDLRYHLLLKEDKTFPVKVLPSYRPDKGIAIDADAFLPWVEKLETVVGRALPGYEDFLGALDERLDFFVSVGARVSDHGLGNVPFVSADGEELDRIYRARRDGKVLSAGEADAFRTGVLLHLGKAYAKRGLVQQYHISPTRNNNTVAFHLLGPDTGFDAISDELFLKNLAKLLDALEKEDALPKTVLYSLNPGYDEMLAALAYCFNKDVPGKMQLGTAWWFNDHIDGMEKQLHALASVGLLGRFVGMLTDSRSFLSYPRHDYFRRILCRYLGMLVTTGQYPEDYETLGKTVRGICFENAEEYFGLK